MSVAGRGGDGGDGLSVGGGGGGRGRRQSGGGSDSGGGGGGSGGRPKGNSANGKPAERSSVIPSFQKQNYEWKRNRRDEKIFSF